MRVSRAALLLISLVLLGAAPSGAASQVESPLGDIEPGTSVTIVFRATVRDPLSVPAAQVVANQGTVSQDGFASVLTDDPTIGGAADPTETTLVPEPGAAAAAATALLAVFAQRRRR